MLPAVAHAAHLVPRGYAQLRQLAARSRALGSTRARQLGILTTCAVLLVLWIDPRLYHALAPRDVLPLVPVPAPSPVLAGRLVALNATLTEHYRSRGRTLAEPVFPYQALTRAQQARYKLLSSDDGSADGGIYLFATLIRQVQDQLPDLLAALVVVIDALGADRVAFTFLEGPSDDLTSSIFTSVLQPLLHTLGVPSRRIRIITDSARLDFSTANRIELLAGLRNDALQPLWQDPAFGSNVKSVIFFNDVYLKAEHMLELLYMHHLNGAGITAAWDWYKREPAYFYDVWVARTIETGDLFYPIPHAWWSPSDELFPSAPHSRAAFDALEPFQVFCSWNGMVVMDPAPFLPPHHVRFRRSDPAVGECAASECGLVCADYWKAGFGKIQVVPSVQLAYERDVAIQTEYLMQKQRRELGWRDGTPPVRGGKLYRGLTWQTQPPERVRCNPWPEKNGLGHNVWEKTEWVPPWL